MYDPIELAMGIGVVSTPTPASKSLNWSETNLMRWVDGRMQPIGGWSKLSLSMPFASPVMAVHRWTSLLGQKLVAYICVNHAYVDTGGTIIDVSPTIPMQAPSANVVEAGYGDNTYSLGSYGTPRPDKERTAVIPNMWSVDNWGENLVFMSSVDGRLLQWSPSSPSTPSAAVANAPVSNRTFIVSPRRHILLFGASGNANRVWWCDEEDNTDWNLADIASKAGDYSVQPYSTIVTCCKAGDDIVMFMSSNDSFVIRYAGLPFVFAVEKFNSESTPISPQGIAEIPNGCVWVAQDGFWRYSSGAASPLECPVWQWVSKNANADFMKFAASFVLLGMFSELYFFFPSGTSESNDRYVSWNYKEGWWSTGKMKRSCGVKGNYTGLPILSDGSDVYQHEYGSTYNLQVGEELPWAKSFSFNPYGMYLASLGPLNPDLGGDDYDLSFQLEYNIKRSGKDMLMYSDEVYLINGIVPFRATGRDFRVVVRQKSNTVSKWTMGNSYLEATRRGKA